MAKREINVAFTCIGFPMWSILINAIRSVDEVNIRVVGMDTRKDIPAERYLDSFVNIPSGKSERYADTMLDICKKEKINIFIPGADEEVFAITKKLNDFLSSGIICTVPPPDKLSIFRDKIHVYDFLSENKIPVPPYIGVRTSEDLEKARDLIPIHDSKIVVKQPDLRGGRGVFLVDVSKRGKRNICERNGMMTVPFSDMLELINNTNVTFLAMEYLIGNFYDVDVLSNHGLPIYLIPRRRFNSHGIPWTSNEITYNKRMIETSERISNLLNLHYLFDFDMFESGDVVYPLEVNPRASGSACASISAGINLYADLIRLILNIPIKSREIPFGKKIYPKLEMHVK